jgi:Leucine-rich repeat (LRR) protein
MTLDSLQLFSLPTSVLGLTNLTALSLAQNHLSRIPDAAGKLLRLKRLDLSHNKLTGIDVTIMAVLAAHD